MMMISDETIHLIIADNMPEETGDFKVVVSGAMKSVIKQALLEAEPIIRKDEREKVAEWLERLPVSAASKEDSDIIVDKLLSIAQQLRSQP